MDRQTSADGRSHMDYLRREGFTSEDAMLSDPEEERESRSPTSPLPESKPRRSGYSPGLAVLFPAGFEGGRLCSEGPESALSETDGTISRTSRASSENAHIMSDSSSPAEVGSHSSASSPATTCLGSSPESPAVASIEQEESPDASVEPHSPSTQGQSEPDQQKSTQETKELEISLVTLDAGGCRETPTSRRSPTPVNRWRCHHPGCSVKPFKSKFQLDSHQRKHLDARDYKCTRAGCKASFRRKNEVTRHVRTVHRGSVPATKNLVCPHCKTKHVFARLDTLQRHIRRIHPGLVST